MIANAPLPICAPAPVPVQSMPPTAPLRDTNALIPDPGRCYSYDRMFAWSGAFVVASIWNPYQRLLFTDAQYTPTPGMSDRILKLSDIKQLPWDLCSRFSRDKSFECSICCVEFNNSLKFVTECGHEFCRSCIVRWALENCGFMVDTPLPRHIGVVAACPMCRSPISIGYTQSMDGYTMDVFNLMISCHPIDGQAGSTWYALQSLFIELFKALAADCTLEQFTAGRALSKEWMDITRVVFNDRIIKDILLNCCRLTSISTDTFATSVASLLWHHVNERARINFSPTSPSALLPSMVRPRNGASPVKLPLMANYMMDVYKHCKMMMLRGETIDALKVLHRNLPVLKPDYAAIVKCGGVIQWFTRGEVARRLERLVFSEMSSLLGHPMGLSSVRKVLATFPRLVQLLEEAFGTPEAIVKMREFGPLVNFDKYPALDRYYKDAKQEWRPMLSEMVDLFWYRIIVIASRPVLLVIGQSMKSKPDGQQVS